MSCYTCSYKRQSLNKKKLKNRNCYLFLSHQPFSQSTGSFLQVLLNISCNGLCCIEFEFRVILLLDQLPLVVQSALLIYP